MHILYQDKESLMYRSFSAQLSNPTKGNWISEILQMMENLELEMELEDVGNIKKEEEKKKKQKMFKSLVKEKI